MLIHCLSYLVFPEGLFQVYREERLCLLALPCQVLLWYKAMTIIVPHREKVRKGTLYHMYLPSR